MNFYKFSTYIFLFFSAVGVLSGIGMMVGGYGAKGFGYLLGSLWATWYYHKTAKIIEGGKN